jgi:hypothetical protein
MAIPSRQIGWGTEENLLWQISKQLESLTRVVYNIGGNTNTTTTTTTTVAPTTTTTTTSAPVTVTANISAAGFPACLGQGMNVTIGLSSTNICDSNTIYNTNGDFVGFTDIWAAVGGQSRLYVNVDNISAVSSTSCIACPTTTTTTTTVAPAGVYTFVINTDGNPPSSGQFKSNDYDNYAYVSKTDFNGGTLPTLQIGDGITYTNGSGGGLVSAVLYDVQDYGTWWYIDIGYVSSFQPGMTDGANYPITTIPVPTGYTIGEAAEGGKIAYILQPGDPGYEVGVQHGLVATVADISTGAGWGCNGTEITGASGTQIGDGAQNTADIVAECGTPGIAARLCSDLVQAGYSDWYLPSQSELYILRQNRIAIGGFTDNIYWSSTEYNSSNAWFCLFSNGYQSAIDKDTPNYVRAIRSF